LEPSRADFRAAIDGDRMAALSYPPVSQR
jgi:hypothetical protein